MTVISVKLDLDTSTLAWVDMCRGNTSRTAWVQQLVEADTPGPGAEHDRMTTAINDILERAVNRATTALTLGRPGYAEYLLRRAEMATTVMEELAAEVYPRSSTATPTAPSITTQHGDTQ